MAVVLCHTRVSARSVSWSCFDIILMILVTMGARQFWLRQLAALCRCWCCRGSTLRDPSHNCSLSSCGGCGQERQWFIDRGSMMVSTERQSLETLRGRKWDAAFPGRTAFFCYSFETASVCMVSLSSSSKHHRTRFVFTLLRKHNPEGSVFVADFTGLSPSSAQNMMWLKVVAGCVVEVVCGVLRKTIEGECR